LVHNLEALSVFVTDSRSQGTGVRVELAVVRALGAPRRVETTQEREDFEQELLDQYLLAAVGAGSCDATVNENRSVIFEFARFLGRPVWTAQPQDADGFLVRQRTVLDRARLTVQHKAWALARFYDFLVLRYQGDIHRLAAFLRVVDVCQGNGPQSNPGIAWP
jgi:hypothetical protein